jgi:hypothetical protein
MKIAGIILIVLQILSIIGQTMGGDNILAIGFSGIGGFFNMIGRLTLGIIGVILLIIAGKRGRK